MRAKIVHVLCEGQTELGFVEKVLKPYLLLQGTTAVKSVLVTTNKKKNARGGMVTYQHAKKDLETLLTLKDGGNEHHVFTTMFDLYALPADFPGYNDSQRIADKYNRVASLENEYSSAVNDGRFIPYIQLHEFEALVLCGLKHLSDLYAGCEKRCEALIKHVEHIGNPELVNDNPDTAPSKRIIKAVEGDPKHHFRYNKPATGKYITNKIGIDELRKQCKHFDEWVEKIIKA
ncbi:DUF4276 family protein [[Hallella] seregens]|uniref:DUF4276 family protein n=1 Tax=Hallella seregens ATCC 51272 TaxID=1336250 RepID=A0ABV5ZHM0_9BACT|nr:DUF4276 family protein [Hallella seregens]